MNGAPDKRVVLWRLVDGRPGHDNQTLGLCRALAKTTSCERHDIEVAGKRSALGYLLSGRYPPAEALPAPTLILGAGHDTHLHLLAARRARGGRTIVLMRPSLPCPLFDLCLIPKHDGYRGGGCYLETQGVLNTLEDPGSRDDSRALVLIGGPSRHHVWDPQGLLRQIGQLLDDRPDVRFTLTTSRRTPETFLDLVRALQRSNLEVVPRSDTPPGWVAEQLSQAAVAWVSEDSVSMVYESLTAGVAVGVLALPRRGVSRVSRGLDRLLADGLVTRLDPAGAYLHRLHPVTHFNEAARCAEWIAHRWLNAD